MFPRRRSAVDWARRSPLSCVGRPARNGGRVSAKIEITNHTIWCNAPTKFTVMNFNSKMKSSRYFFAKTLSHPEGMLKGRCRQCGWQEEEKKPKPLSWASDPHQLSFESAPAEHRSSICVTGFTLQFKIFGTTLVTRWKPRRKAQASEIGEWEQAAELAWWEYCPAGLGSSDQLDLEWNKIEN